LVQYIIDRGIKGRLLIRFYDCFNTVVKRGQKKSASLMVLRNLITSIGLAAMDQVCLREDTIFHLLV